MSVGKKVLRKEESNGRETGLPSKDQPPRKLTKRVGER